MLMEPRCTYSIISSRYPSQPDLDKGVTGNYFFGRSLLKLSRIKRSQVMSMGKFGPAALNFS